MSKAVMLSIRPKWCEKIASGEKTIEVRKTRGSWGKVIGEFTCDGFWIGSPRNTNPIFCMAACMDGFDTEKYAKDKILYGWHISDLKIYDTPRELGEFERPYECGECNAKWASECNACYEENKIKRAPQSWCYVEAMEDV